VLRSRHGAGLNASHESFVLTLAQSCVLFDTALLVLDLAFKSRRRADLHLSAGADDSIMSFRRWTYADDASCTIKMP